MTAQSASGLPLRGEQVHKRISATLIAGLALTALAGCSGSDGTSTATTSSPSSAVSSPAPREDPEVQKAIDAYEAFRDASNLARENPVAKGKPWARGSDFEKWSFDPARSDTAVFVHALASFHAEYRGDRPGSNVRVLGSNLRDKPYPRVSLSDCQVPSGLYVPYDRKTGKKLKLAGGVDLEKPYLTDVEVIAVKGQWGVRSVQLEVGKTCAP